MSKNLIRFVGVSILVLTSNSYAANSAACSAAGKKIEIKAAGFAGLTKKEAQKKTSIGRISPVITDGSVYDASYEIGSYRFVKEKEKWVVYRMKEGSSPLEYEKRSDLDLSKKSIKVSKDQPIYVHDRGNGTLEVSRQVGDSNLAGTATVQFTKTQITVSDTYKNKITIPVCSKAATADEVSTSSTSSSTSSSSAGR